MDRAHGDPRGPRDGTSRSARLLLLALAVLLLAAIAAFAAVLADAQRSSRDDIEGRLHDRAVAGATLLSSLFRSSNASGRAALSARLGGEDGLPAALARQARDGRLRFAVLARPDGDVIASAPGTPAGVLRAIGARPAWLAPAARGQIGSSSVANSAQRGLLTFAIPFPARDGARVLVEGSDPRVVGVLLAGALERLPTSGGETYLLDVDGRVVASPNEAIAFGSRPPERGLRAAVAAEHDGDLPGGDYLASAPIDGVPWRVVITAPHDTLFASVAGVKSWGPWALLAGFALVAALAIALVARSIRDAGRIRAAGERLERSNAALAERAGELSYANHRLRDLNDELARSNAELERFASIASHDLREPLRKVQMFSERVQHHDGDRLSDRGRDYLGRMESAAARMQTLIDGLLAYARMAPQDAERTEDIALEDIAREVVDDLEGLRRETGGEVVVGSLPHVTADPVRMRQLLQNLITNALRFHRPEVPPVVRVEGERDEAAGEIELRVSDNGIGFAPEYAERIFDLFQRLHPRGRYPGTGMGLALCRRIVEAHGGSITATSSPDSGTTFTVRLAETPAVAQAEAPAPPPHAEHL